MSKVDWSLAPEGATHWAMGESIPVWFKDVRKGTSYQFMNEGRGYRSPWMIAKGDPALELVERPKPATWSGPQDGLPPVGELVDYMGEHCKVVAHVMERNEKGAILQGADDWFYGTEITIDPIRTAADIAAEKRENAIRELMDIAQVDCRVTAARLVDAGFKREVV